MGHYLPQATFDVVYAFAFENCIFMLFLIGEEVLGPAFLPVFMRERTSSLKKAPGHSPIRS
jgi:peptidoglycan biosynthesis protein MviN/MurJ (putative lipid II flippase)